MAEANDYTAPAVLLDGQGHDVLRATGKDRITFLHRITSGTVVGKAPGQGGRTLLLDVRGHVLASLVVCVREESVRLLVPGGQGPETAAGIAKFAVMDDFQIAIEPELTTLAILGPQAAGALAKVGVAVPPTLLESPLFTHLDVPSEAYGSLWIAHGRACGTDGLCVVVKGSARAALVAALLATGTPRLAPEVAEALRISALEPKLGSEITPDRFPVEIGLGAAIDHGKGCYLGQETIVRLRDRGTIRKRLVLLRLAGADLPSPGDKIAAESVLAAGQITSAGCLPGENPVALALMASGIPVGSAVQIQHGDTQIPAEIAAESLPWG
jgi:folate-binding protein YgfZ